jgi:hypothetical protein
MSMVIPRIEEYLRRVPGDDLVMFEQWGPYALERIQWITDGVLCDHQTIRDKIRGIVLHNGSTCDEVKTEFPDAKALSMPLTREASFLDMKTETLHFAQPSSDSRRDRFEDMITTGLILAQNWDIDFRSVLYQDSELETFRRYEKNAAGLVGRIAESMDLHGIDAITMGDINWLREE